MEMIIQLAFTILRKIHTIPGNPWIVYIVMLLPVAPIADEKACI
jgi:hypothetical protein